jgi:hypothetical protein
MSEMKELLLEILKQSFQPSDIQAVQQMGVNMSAAVKREGVVIIQNQNVEVVTRIIPLLVKALKLCDKLEIVDRQPVIEIPQEIPISNPVEACCSLMYKNNMNWEDMQDFMRIEYLKYVLSRYRTKVEASKMLGVGVTYLSKLSKTIKEE